MKTNRNAMMLGLLLTLAGTSTAAITRVGTTAGTFLTIEQGCRAQAMGGAYTAIANDASCLYWNPAGALELQGSEAMALQTEYLVDSKMNYLGFVSPLADYYAIGASMTYLDFGEIGVTTVDEPDGTGEFYSASDMAMGLTFAMRFTDRFTLGMTGKFVQSKIWHMSSTAVALDMGTMYHTGWHGIILGMGIYNYGTEMTMGGSDMLVGNDEDENSLGNNPAVPAELHVQDWPLPLSFRIGVSGYAIENPQHSLLLAADAVHPTDNSEFVNLGMEYGFRNRFFVRGGYNELFLKDKEGGLTLGAGVTIPMSNGLGLKLDAAWEDMGRLEEVVRYSLGITW